MKLFCIFIFTSLLLIFCSGQLEAESIQAILSTSDGSTGLQIINSNSKEVGIIDSLGNIRLDGVLNSASTRESFFFGKLGIGTTSPVEILDVKGTMEALHYIGDGSHLTGLPTVDFSDSGEVAGMNRLLGNIDNFDLTLITNNLPRLTVKNSGKIGVGTSNPEFKLTIDKGAASPDGGIMAIGTYGSGTSLETSGAGTRMFWYPKKAAFRAGNVESDQWDDVKIGECSIATGDNAIASGWASTAMGFNTIASGDTSTSMGSGTVGSGWASMAIGADTVAGGWVSTAMGFRTVASGDNSTAMGVLTTASGYASTAT
ncbi:MAG: hypothetical protein PHW04_14790, partial [Candidatus Wallbacteria bacterium]|nr:hypothetical protein [Candidatus Wallbacteria bacterium]